MLHQHAPLLRTYALLLERRGYEVTVVDSTIQMILKLEVEEDCFEGIARRSFLRAEAESFELCAICERDTSDFASSFNLEWSGI